MTDLRPPVRFKPTEVRTRWMEVEKVKLLDIDWSVQWYHETTYISGMLQLDFLIICYQTQQD